MFCREKRFWDSLGCHLSTAWWSQLGGGGLATLWMDVCYGWVFFAKRLRQLHDGWQNFPWALSQALRSGMQVWRMQALLTTHLAVSCTHAAPPAHCRTPALLQSAPASSSINGPSRPACMSLPCICWHCSADTTGTLPLPSPPYPPSPGCW
jgi:hypothetical protein